MLIHQGPRDLDHDSKTLEDVLLSAKQCKLCSRFTAYEEDLKPFYVFRLRLDNFWYNALCIRVSYKSEPDDDGMITEHVFRIDFSVLGDEWDDPEIPWLLLESKDDEPVFPLIVTRTTFSTLSSPSALYFVQTQLKACQETHTACNNNRLPEALPTRLLSICSSGADISVHLSIPERHESYVALSYCWGTTPLPLRTTKDNINEHLAGIAWDKLPLTLQHAIEFTRLLGYSHIWIDALCIVQDGDEWDKEASRMHIVYAGAALTLSISGGRHCGAGFLGRKSNNSGIDFPLELMSKDGIVSKRTLRALDMAPQHHPRPRGERIYGPLQTRGWPLQERILSSAVLHFETFEMMYECCHTSISETGQIFRSVMKQGEQDPRAEKVPSERSTLERWLYLMEEYSRRRLTKSADRLPALDGLSKHFQIELGFSQYIAGMWIDHLLESLLWTAAVSVTWEEYASAFEGYIAPSWSPLSFPYEVAYWWAEAQIRPTATICSFDCKTAAPGNFGRILSAHIVLESCLYEPHEWASILEVELARKREFDENVNSRPRNSEATDDDDDEDDDYNDSYGRFTVTHVDGSTSEGKRETSRWFFYWDASNSQLDEEYWLLELGYWHRQSSFRFYLILERTTIKENGSPVFGFRRIGLLRFGRQIEEDHSRWDEGEEEAADLEREDMMDSSQLEIPLSKVARRRVKLI